MSKGFAVYARCNEQDDEAINLQLATLITKIVKEYGVDLVKIFLFVDNGCSDDDPGRTGYKTLLKQIDEGEESIEYIYVADFSKLTNNTGELKELVNLLVKHNIKVLCGKGK